MRDNEFYSVIQSATRARQCAASRTFTHPILMIAAPHLPPTTYASATNFPSKQLVLRPPYPHLGIAGMPVVLNHRMDAVVGRVDSYVMGGPEQDTLYLRARVTKQVHDDMICQNTPVCCSVRFGQRTPASSAAWMEVSVLPEGVEPAIPYSFVLTGADYGGIPTDQELRASHLQSIADRARHGRIHFNALMQASTGQAGQAGQAVQAEQAGQSAAQPAVQSAVQQGGQQQMMPPVPDEMKYDEWEPTQDSAQTNQYLRTLPGLVAKLSPELGVATANALANLLRAYAKTSEEYKQLKLQSGDATQQAGQAEQAEQAGQGVPNQTAPLPEPQQMSEDQAQVYANSLLYEMGVSRDVARAQDGYYTDLVGFLRQANPEAISTAMAINRHTERLRQAQPVVKQTEAQEQPTKRAKNTWGAGVDNLVSTLTRPGVSTYNPATNPSVAQAHASQLAARSNAGQAVHANALTQEDDKDNIVGGICDFIDSLSRR